MTKKRMLMLSLSVGILVAMPAMALEFEEQAGNATDEKVLVDFVSDVSLTNNSGTIVIGNSTAAQVALDNNEIQARNNGAATTLYLQEGGGLLDVGGDLDIEPDTNLYMDANPIATFSSGITTFYEDIEVLGHTDLGVVTFDTTGSGSTHLCYSSATGAPQQCSSAARFKTNVAELGWGLREVMAMRPVSFAWKEDERQDVGFIAEETLAVVPELVEYNKEGTVQGFNYSHYTAVLTRALQEQQKTIEHQAEDLNATRQAVAAREKQIAELQAGIAEVQKLRAEVAALTKVVERMVEPRP